MPKGKHIKPWTGPTYKLCECGCGQQTNIAKGTDCRKGVIRGQPHRYLRGHYKGLFGVALLTREQRIKHGHGVRGIKKSPEYTAWMSARDRCNNKNKKQYKDYGGRGIQLLFPDFPSFLADVGPKPTQQHTLDRIDNEMNYQPGNVRWSTRKEQRKNQRSRWGAERHLEEVGC